MQTRQATRAVRRRTETFKTSPSPKKRKLSTSKTELTTSSSRSPETKLPPSSIDNQPNNQSDEKKWRDWSRLGHLSPFKDFARPTEAECRHAHRILDGMHGETVKDNFADDADAAHYPHVMDAVIVAALSQGTSWSNAKRAMANMDLVYGSRFAYDEIVEGGMEKLQQALRPGGMQNRKAAMLLGLLEQVKNRHGRWDLDFLFDADNDEVMKELLRYKGIGPKCAHCVMSICLNRTTFAVDTHIYRISGLWGWRPESATPQQAQSHLDARVPNALKFSIHYLLIVHGRECTHCRGGAKRTSGCETLKKIRDAMKGDH
ncbi:hypothetical protein MBLNU13_g00777t1 [Cladosporium sp. NU13]